MRRLLPDPVDEVDLDEELAYPAAGVWVRGVMVSSADGAASAEGRTEGLSSPGDKRLFGTLRALADVILVGASTARAERYGPADPRPSYAARRAAAGQLPAPAMAVVSRSLDFDPAGPLLTEPAAAPTIVLTCAAAPPERVAALREHVEVVVVGDRDVDLGAAVAALVERGLRRVSCEGGPALLAQVAAADLLDELSLTYAPLLLAGTAPRILRGPALDPVRRLTLAGLLEEDGFLFARYLRR